MIYFHRIMALMITGATLGWTGFAWAGSVVAIVEDVKADNAGVAFMDYLNAGREIRLGKKGRLVLGYLNSCLREEITGGTVTIGKDKSVVQSGKLFRKRVECDGGRLLLTAEEAGKSAVVVFRKGTAQIEKSSRRPSLRIFSSQPVLKVRSRPGHVTIERLDRPGSPLTIELHNGVADFVAKNLSLQNGGIYRVEGGGSSRIIRVDAYADRGGSLIGRLVTF